MDDRKVLFELNLSNTEPLTVEDPRAVNTVNTENIFELPEVKPEHQDDYKNLVIEQLPLEDRSVDIEIYNLLKNGNITFAVGGAFDPNCEILSEERILELESRELVTLLIQMTSRSALHSYVNLIIDPKEEIKVIPLKNKLPEETENFDLEEISQRSTFNNMVTNIETHCWDTATKLIKASKSPVYNPDLEVYAKKYPKAKALILPKEHDDFWNEMKKDQEEVIEKYSAMLRRNEEHKERMQDLLISLSQSDTYDNTLTEEAQHRVEFWKTYFEQGYNPEQVKTESTRRKRNREKDIS